MRVSHAVGDDESEAGDWRMPNVTVSNSRLISTMLT